MARKKGTFNWDMASEALGCTPREFINRYVTRYTDREMAGHLERALGRPFSLYQIRQQRRVLGNVKDVRQRYLVTESPFVRLDHPMRIEADVAVIGDLELPFHEHRFLGRVLELADRWGIRQVVFNGDLLHHHALSSWGADWQAEGGPEGKLSSAAAEALDTLALELGGEAGDRVRDFVNQAGVQSMGGGATISEEWKFARETLTVIRQVFSEAAWLVLGNHEARMLRSLESPLLPSDIRRLLVGEDGWMKTASYYYALIVSGGTTWRATHPKNTSVRPASVAAALADKFGSNVLQSHNHLWGMTQSASGRHLGVEIGCGVDGARLPYYAERDTTRPAWQNGAAIIRDGKCHLLHPEWTDWDRLAKC